MQKTQNVTTLVDLTNVAVGKAIMGTEENVKVCKNVSKRNCYKISLELP